MVHKQLNSDKTNAVGQYLLNGTCRYFTLFCVLLLILAFFDVFGSPDSAPASVPPIRFLLLLPLAATVAAANAMYRFTAWSGTLRHVVHMVLCLLGFYLFVCLPVQLLSGGSVFVMFAFACLLYIIGLVVYVIVKRKKDRKQAKDVPYQNQFIKSKK